MTSRFEQRRRRFRQVLAGAACIHPASVFDPISARIAEDLGFEAGILAGSVASLVVLGAPDNITLTLSEFAEQARRICRASSLPLMVDADHGYGNALNVMRTVEELEGAGIAGLSIEDTVLPQPFGSGGQPSLTSIAEGVGKMRAAVSARRDPDLVIAARTSAVAISGLADAQARVAAYASTGVDAIFVVGLTRREQVEAIRSVTALPLILGGVPEALMDQSYLAANNVRICLTGHQPIEAAVAVVHRTLQALRAGTPPAALQDLADAHLKRLVTRADAYDRWERDFLDQNEGVSK